MCHLDWPFSLGQMPVNLLGHCYGTVLPTGAAHRDGEVVSAAAGKFREEKIEQGEEMGKKLVAVFMVKRMGGYRFIQPGFFL